MNERVLNTHGKGERVKIPLLPNNVGKKSVNDAGPKQGHDKYIALKKDYKNNKSEVLLVDDFVVKNIFSIIEAKRFSHLENQELINPTVY